MKTINQTRLFITLFTILALSGASLSLECIEGCLKCSQDNLNNYFCEICDLYNSYYMTKSGNCIYRAIENCYINSIDQSAYLCAQCSAGYMLDTVQAKCVLVTNGLKVSDCRQYTEMGTCNECYQHYYLENGNCVRSSVKIDKCNVYFSDDLCAHCEDDYLFNEETKMCEAFSPIKKCEMHTHGECVTCSSGYFKSGNPILYKTSSKSMIQQRKNDLFRGVNYSRHPMAVCLPSIDRNCKEMEALKTGNSLIPICTACNKGYYLDTTKNLCMENPWPAIKQCKEYTTLSICKECELGFYLSCNSCLLRSFYSQCSVSDPNADKCGVCKENYFLGPNDVCIERTNKRIGECKTEAASEDVCAECNANYKLTQDRIGCFAEVANCGIYSAPVLKADGKFLCEKCEDSHSLNLERTLCTKQLVNNCETFMSYSITCGICQPSFYLTPGNNLCSKQTLLNCKTPVYNANECAICENLYKLDPTLKTCSKINNVGCSENQPNLETCMKCEGNLLMVSENSLNVCKTSTDFKPVDFCKTNSKSDPKTLCDVCEDSHMLISNDSFNIKQSTENCVSIKNQKCNQCDVGFILTLNPTTNDITCVKSTNPNSVCLQNIADVFGPLDSNDFSCVNCREETSHYHKSNNCFRRSSKSKANCQKTTPTSDDCINCAENFSATNKYSNDISCVQNPDNFSPLTDCLVHSIIEPTNCVYCQIGTILTRDFKCERASNKINHEVYFPHGLVSKVDVGLEFWTDVSALVGCKLSARIYNSVQCLECLDSYYQVVSEDYGDVELDGLSFFKDQPVVTCISVDQMVKKSESNKIIPYVSSSECSNVSLLDGYYTCVACKNKLNAIMVYSELDNTGAIDILSKKIPTVKSCTPGNSSLTLSKKYKGIGYRPFISFGSESVIPIEFLYDSCPQENDTLIGRINYTLNDGKFFTVPGGSTNSTERYRCHNYGASAPVPNCQVYAIDATSGDINYNDAKCVSCKPGYRPSLNSISDHRFIPKCTAIADCDVSDPAKNTWLNACQTCNLGKHYSIMNQNSKHIINYSKCVTNFVQNCLLELYDECLVCKAGYTHSGLICVAAPSVDFCQDLGFSLDSFKPISLENSQASFNNKLTAYIKNLYMTTYRYGKCKKCSPGYSHFTLSINSNTMACTSNATLTNLTANCKIFSGLIANRCVICKDEYILNSDYSCIGNPNPNNYQNCSQVTPKRDSFECIKCSSSFELDPSTKTCMKFDNCKEYIVRNNQLVCNHCSDYYMVHPGKNTQCVKSTIPGCKTMKGYYCETCDAGLLHIKLELKYESADYVSICTLVPFSDVPLKNSQFKFSKETKAKKLVFDEFSYDSNFYYLSSDVKGYTAQVCFPGVFPNCEILGNEIGFCEKCKKGYYKESSTSNCPKNSVDNCDVQININECDTCKVGFFRTQFKLCQAHNILNCEQYMPTADKCLKCKADYFINDGICYKHFIQNCLVYEESKDFCIECKPNFHQKNGECHHSSVVGCKTYSKTHNLCDSCFDMHYKKEGSCLRHTAEHCKEYNLELNQCASCTESDDITTNAGRFYLNPQKVCEIMKEVPNCQEYSKETLTAGDCTVCLNNFLLLGKVCSNRPSGVPYCEVYSSSTNCTKCQPQFYFNGGKTECLPIYKPLDNCLYYESQTKCSECESGFLVSSSQSACNPTNETSCKTWSLVDSCASCNAGYSLVETPLISSDTTTNTKICKIQIPNCVDLLETDGASNGDPKTYTCQQCTTGYFLSTDKLSCQISAFIANCEFFSSSEICSKCFRGFVLSRNQKSCSRNTELVGSNCEDARISEEIICNCCQSGTVLNFARVCEQCGGNGCDVCNPEDTSTCALCGMNYYMNRDQSCSSNNAHVFTLVKESLVSPNEPAGLMGGDRDGGLGRQMLGLIVWSLFMVVFLE